MDESSKIESDMSRMYQRRINTLKNMVQKAIVTDIIELTTVEMYEFIKYWVAPDKPDEELEMLPISIPIDIFCENTVPIPNLQIVHNQDLSEVGEHPMTSYTTVIINEVVVSCLKDTIDELDTLDKLKSGEYLIIAGAFDFKAHVQGNAEYIINEIYPLIIDLENMNVALGIPDDGNLTKDKEFIARWATIHLNAWYGIQLALLHPATVNIFSNPRKVKRSRKEQLETFTTDENGMPKRVKYVRHHTIKSGENGVYDEINKALNTHHKSEIALTEDSSDSTKKYTRKKLLWRVIGHWRTLSTGKVVWVRSHWRGILRDMPTERALRKNDRVVDINKE